MDHMVVLFDSQLDAEDALNQLHRLGDRVDVRVYEHQDTLPEIDSDADLLIPPTGLGLAAVVPPAGMLGLGLTDIETEYFTGRLQPGNSLVVIDAPGEMEESILEIVSRHNGQRYVEE